jgi:hypothetical protein
VFGDRNGIWGVGGRTQSWAGRGASSAIRVGGTLLGIQAKSVAIGTFATLSVELHRKYCIKVRMLEILKEKEVERGGAGTINHLLVKLDSPWWTR